MGFDEMGVTSEIMGRGEEFGTVEAGKRADLILVDGNPAADIHDIRKIAKVVTAGRLYDCGKLWQSVGFRP